MRNSFQHQIATGIMTLPVAIIISLVIWITAYNNLLELVPFIIGGITAYLLIELNTFFALIRSRSSLPSALFVILYSSSLFLHEYGKGECWILLLFLGSFYCLLRGHELKNTPGYTFHAFLGLGIASMIVPDLIYCIPLLFITMIQMRMLNLRTFFAGILGYCIPFWILTGYDLYKGNEIQVLTWFNGITQWSLQDYLNIPLPQSVTVIFVLLLSAISGINSMLLSLNDKVRTRIFIRVINITGIYITSLLVIKPMMINSLLPILMALASILFGYTMILKSNKFTNIFMIITVIFIAALAAFNMIIHFLPNIDLIQWMQ